MPTSAIVLMVSLAGCGQKPNNKEAEKIQMPPKEALFCKILEKANDTVTEMPQVLDTNGLVADKQKAQFNAFINRRNLDILRIVGGSKAIIAIDEHGDSNYVGISKPKIIKWTVRLNKIDTQDLFIDGVTRRYITISGTFPCKLSVSFKAKELPTTPANVKFLISKKIGDYIVLTAFLAPHGKDTPQDALFWNLFSNTITTPQFYLLIESMSTYKSSKP